MKQELRQINDKITRLNIETRQQRENAEVNYKKEKERIGAEFRSKYDELEKERSGISGEIVKGLKYAMPIVVNGESVSVAGLTFRTGHGFLDKDGDEFYHTVGHGVDIYLTSEDLYGFIDPIVWKERYLRSLEFIAEKILDAEKKKVLNEVAKEFKENFLY